MRIDELMTRPVVSCRPGDTLDAAVNLMIERDCGALPVIGNDGHVAGIITDRDVCVAAYRERIPLSDIRVERAMTAHIVAARPRDSVESVEKLMAEHQVRRVPVVDDKGHVVGMVSLNDIVRSASRAHREDARVIQTMAAICEPRHGSALTTERSSTR